MESNHDVIPAKAGIYEFQKSKQIPAFAGMTKVYLALGSNIGDRLAFLNKAVKILGEHTAVQIQKVSTVYETEPWPKTEESEQGFFLNQVLEVQTSLTPMKLLNLFKAIEKEVGRSQTRHWGPREIDIDILLYGDKIIDLPELKIPHPHMAERQFVLIPLLEIAPDLKDPMTCQPFSDMLKDVQQKDPHRVTPFTS